MYVCTNVRNVYLRDVYCIIDYFGNSSSCQGDRFVQMGLPKNCLVFMFSAQVMDH